MKFLNIFRGEPNLCSAAFGRKDFRIISFQLHDANFQKTELIEGILNLTLVCKATANSKSTFGRKNFRIVSFQLHDANIQKTEFIARILNVVFQFTTANSKSRSQN